MKALPYFKTAVYGLAVSALVLSSVSCQSFRQSGNGELLVRFNTEGLPQGTRAQEQIPDTDDFILDIVDSDSRTVYNGRFGDSPESFSLSAGAYTVSAWSAEFESPEFDSPQWGDTQTVSVKAGGSIATTLECTQLHCGLRLLVEDSFRQAFPYGSLLVKAREGELEYSYDESRTAYFKSGSVNVCLLDAEEEQSLFTRTLEPRQVLSVKLKADIGQMNGRISIQIDTTRNYIGGEYCYDDRDYSLIENALKVDELKDHLGESTVWVEGYIVGVATGTSKFSFTPPFEKNTNILLGLRSNTSQKEWCISAELRSGAIRDELNLVDNPNLKGRKVTIKGSPASSYFGIPGLKAVSEYQF